MDSQLASVLTGANLDVQNGSRSAERSGPLTDVLSDTEVKSSPCSPPGDPQPSPVKAVMIIRPDVPSISGNKLEVGGTSLPASQETGEVGQRLMTVKTEVPELHSQPITLKIVVPRRSKRPITNSATCLTKDSALTNFEGPFLVSSEVEISENNKTQMSTVQNEGEEAAEQAKPEPFLEPERSETLWKEKDNWGPRAQNDGSDPPLISCTYSSEALSTPGMKEETTEREIEENSSLTSQEMELNSCETFDDRRVDEQTEPLDLSLPKKRESQDRRCGRFLADSGCESSLIMEVDEYEGEGDRDLVEEDDEVDGGDSVSCLDGTDLLSPSFCSTSAFTSLTSIDGDAENVLLIDDQGIPYTLSPDGLKMPQVDASTSEDPQSNLATSAEVEGRRSPQLGAVTDSSFSQSLDDSVNEPLEDLCPSPTPGTDSSSLVGDQTKTPEVFTNPDHPKTAEPSVKSVHASAVLASSPGVSVPTQPIPILAKSSTNPPILLLPSSSSSAQLSSAPIGLTLPVSVTQSAPGTSTPMFLLLSSVPSSSGDAASTPTPVAVLDPSTGQLSQITASSAPVCLPLPSGQVSTLGSPLPTLSHPVIRLSPGNAPVILSGVNTINSSTVLASITTGSSPPALQNDNNNGGTTAVIQSQTSSSNSNSGSEAISAEDVLNENKPSISTASSPHLQSSSLTFDPSAQPTSAAQSPASEAHFDPPDSQSHHLPLDDHLYFSSTAAPPSPPTEPILPTGKLNPLDPLDPLDTLSSGTSPNAMNPRRVLYCQLCPRVFFYLSDLERHAITHSQKKPHVCHQCGKAFKRSSHLQRHKHIHTGQRNFVCPICTKRFREAGELQRHQRVHTGEKPYQCQLCHTRFAERNTLRRHTKRKHPYHQVAIEMLNERRGGSRRDAGGGGSGGGSSGGGGGSTAQEEEESAEWYSSTVSHLDNSESELET
ncbi:zinc finger protein 236 [Antennarius striatus]|uniref:zinc finger protein 236 n=1 Tax=Antennarius striatus TaxID=241820 RepID=UPI0035AF5283